MRPIITSLLYILLDIFNGLIQKNKQLAHSLVLLHFEKFFQLEVSLQNIEFYIRLQLSQTNNTQLQWFFTAFLKMIAAIHQTLVINTVSHPKHMSYFVAHHPHRSEFNQIIINFVLLQLEEALIIPRK